MFCLKKNKKKYVEKVGIEKESYGDH
jgi:hypothetical protein